MTAERFFASRILLTHETSRVFVCDLNSYEQELFDKVLEEATERDRADFYYEGAINLHCRRGSVQIYGSHVI